MATKTAPPPIASRDRLWMMARDRAPGLSRDLFDAIYEGAQHIRDYEGMAVSPVPWDQLHAIVDHKIPWLIGRSRTR